MSKMRSHHHPKNIRFGVFFFLALSYTVSMVNSVELTFELPDNARECFHEEILKNQSATLEFQVVSGGRYDVDLTLESPTGEVIYRQQKTQFDSYNFVAAATGIYTACFSNEFSTFSHKIVYMDFQVGDEQPLPGIEEHATVLTQLEVSAQEIHKGLNAILDFQTHHRLREAQGKVLDFFKNCIRSPLNKLLLMHACTSLHLRKETSGRFERTGVVVVIDRNGCYSRNSHRTGACVKKLLFRKETKPNELSSYEIINLSSSQI
uniref:GOLD domain-containing protein n=1 Tax=Anopheles atroparvus TaxID=41427 RepID=A0AAG5DN50_ANOAO